MKQENLAQMAQHHNSNYWFIDCGVTAINFNRRLWRPRTDFVRQELGAALLLEAAGKGIAGGMMTYQVGPHLHKLPDTPMKAKVGERHFRHQLCLLGLVAGPRSEVVKRFAGISFVGPQLPPNEERAVVEWAALPADCRHALRFFLAGSSVGYHLKRLDLIPHPSQTEAFRYGIRGAMSLQPLMMYDRVQWDSYVTVTKGLPLYQTFGDWRGRLGPATPQKLRAASYFPTEADLAAFRQRLPLLNRNAKLRADTEARRRDLVELARPLWVTLKGQRTGKRGRPALRQPLQALLADQDMEVTSNDLDWLVNMLNQETNLTSQNGSCS